MHRSGDARGLTLFMQDCGMIRVTIIDAINLKAADRNGKSDPYCQIYLNKVKMQHAKTSIQKKTLNPKWNEVSSTVTRGVVWA